jgi:hypothetical protein
MPRCSPPRPLALVALVFAACDGTAAVDAPDGGPVASGPPGLSRVSTELSQDTIPAGTSTRVTCAAFDQYGAPFAAPLAFRVIDAAGDPPEGVSAAGDIVTATWAGTYRVICAHTGTPAVSDTSPPVLKVEPGAPVAIRTIVLDTTVPAGTRVNTACSVTDAQGNRAAGEVSLRVSPEAGVSVEGRVATFETAGTYSLACALADGSLVSAEPVTVTVEPGALALLETALSPAVVHPGEATTVTCAGRDRFGNAIPLTRVLTRPVDGLSAADAQRLVLSGTRAGLYGVECLPQDAWITATSVPAQLEIVPGEPAALALGLSPDRAVYSVGQRVQLNPVLSDAFGNVITSMSDALRLETRLGDALRQTLAPGERAQLDAEGRWTITAILGAPWNFRASRAVLADASAPVIDLTTPTRGQMVTSPGNAMQVTGTVTDLTGGLTEVTWNGGLEPVTLGALSYRLARSLVPTHGVNSFTVTARDVSGNFTRVAQSFLAAPEYKPATSAFDDGLQAHFAAAFFDDGVRAGRVDDLATVAERALGRLDADAFVPSPVVSANGYDVYLRDIRHDPPKVAITPARDLLQVALEVRDLAVDVDAQGFVDAGGTVRADRVAVTLQLEVTVVNGQPRVTQRTPDIRIENLRFEVHWSIDWLANLFADRVEAALAEALRQQLAATLPAMIRDLLRQVELNQTFTVPALFPGMSPLNVALTATLERASLSEAGLDVALRTRASAARRVNWATRGSVMRGGCFGTDGGSPDWDEGKRLGAAVALDVLNQVLHAVWQGGALELPLDEASLGVSDLADYSISDLTMFLSARLPPLLTDCRGSLVLQLAELQADVEATLGGLPMKVSLVIAVETEATLSLEGGRLKLGLAPIRPERVLIEILEVDSPLFDANAEVELIDFLRGLVLEKALAEIADESLADFPLPRIDLGAVDPSLAGVVIDFGAGTLVRRRGFVTLSTDP